VPDLSRREQAYSPVSMMSALWEHGPRILEEMQKRNLPWPRFTQTEMSDLIAYLNALPRPGGPAQPVVLRAEIIPLTGERAVLSATK